jgi:uncharacterized protein YfdQ (DUF2303 family)
MASNAYPTAPASPAPASTDAILTGSALTKAVSIGQQLADAKIMYVDAGKGLPFILRPDGMNLTPVDHLVPERPDRIRQAVTMRNVESFCEYVNRFKTPATVLFGTVVNGNGNFMAVLDYHAPDAPDYHTHVCSLVMEQTEAFRAWSEYDGKQQAQLAFAEFIEDHLMDIVNPDGATMLEVAKAIVGSSESAFTGKVSLCNDGVTISYQENITANAGVLTVPETMEILVSPFFGCKPCIVKARFRYRVEKPRLTLGYKIIGRETLMREIIDRTSEQITDATELPVFGGSTIV